MEAFSLNATELKNYVKFQYPFLLIDRVTQVIPGKSASGYKYFTNNDWFFPAHFPDEPMVPGALQFEAIGQMLNVALNTLPGLAKVTTRLVSFDVKCKRVVLPGDKFDIVTTVTSFKRGICKGTGIACVDGETACEANIILTVPSLMEQFLPNSPQ